MQQPTFLRHRGRLLRLLAFPLLAIGFTVLLAFQTTSPDPEIQAAQTWFSSTYPTPSFMGVSVMPNWALARKVAAPSGALYVEVPLDKNIQWNIGNVDGGTLNQNEISAVNGHVTLVIELYNSTYNALFCRITGTQNFVNAYGKAAVLQTRFDQVQSNFSGVLEYFTMDSQSFRGAYISNGTASGTIKSTWNNAQGVAQDRDCLECYNLPQLLYTDVTAGGQTTTTYVGTTLSVVCVPMGGDDCLTIYLSEGWLTGLYWANYYNGNSPNNPNDPPPPPDDEKPCVLTNQKLVKDGPTVTWSIFLDLLHICHANTWITTRLTDCVTGAIAAESSINQSSCGANIDHGASTILVSTRIHYPSTKKWFIGTTNIIKVKFSYTIWGGLFQGTGIESNFTYFDHYYL